MKLPCPIYKDCAQKLNNPVYYCLISELRPNGSKVFYSYDDAGRLQKITALNHNEKQIFGQLHIEYHLDESVPHVFMKTPDGQVIHYTFARQENACFQLKEVRTKSFWRKWEYQNGLLVKEDNSENAPIEAAYYPEGANKGFVHTLKTPLDNYECIYVFSKKNRKLLFLMGEKTERISFIQIVKLRL